MQKRLTFLILIILLSGNVAYPGDNRTKTDKPDISPEDKKIIKLLETLDLMEIVENLKMIKNMDILLGDDQNETDN